MVFLSVFIEPAKVVTNSGGSVSFEWPAYCVGWGIPGLQNFFDQNGFGQIICHGCAFGLEHRGRPIKKPWKIAGTHQPLLAKLEKFKCHCSKGSHAPCTGGATSKTGDYTPQMARIIIAGTLVPGVLPRAPENAKFTSSSGRALSGSLSDISVHAVCGPAESSNPGYSLDLSYAGSGEADMTSADRAMAARFTDDDRQHRDKHNSSPTPILGIVVRTIPPSSAEFHSDKGQAAIREEIEDLRKDVTWDESTVSEWSEVRHIKHNGFTPLSGLLFIIMGQKN